MTHYSFDNVKITIRPDLHYTSVSAQGKPTSVVYNVVQGYSLPIYNNDNEELFFSSRVPLRWDGVTSPRLLIFCYLSGAEDVGDKFKLQISGLANSNGGVLSSEVHDYPVETTVLAGRNAQYDKYTIQYDLIPGNIPHYSVLSGRLRRIAASANEVTNEIVVYDWIIEYKRDKLGGTWS